MNIRFMRKFLRNIIISTLIICSISTWLRVNAEDCCTNDNNCVECNSFGIRYETTGPTRIAIPYEEYTSAFPQPLIRVWTQMMNFSTCSSSTINWEYCIVCSIQAWWEIRIYNTSQIQTLYLNNANISQIYTLGWATSLKNLYLNNNSLTSIVNLPSSLEILNLSNNNLSSITDLPSSLKVLNLSNNNLSSVPSTSLLNLSNLTTLDLSSNSISTIWYRWLYWLNSITSLDLSNNQLSNIQGTDFQWSKIGRSYNFDSWILNLSNNNFTAIPEWLNWEWALSRDSLKLSDEYEIYKRNTDEWDNTVDFRNNPLTILEHSSVPVGSGPHDKNISWIWYINWQFNKLWYTNYPNFYAGYTMTSPSGQAFTWEASVSISTPAYMQGKITDLPSLSANNIVTQLHANGITENWTYKFKNYFVSNGSIILEWDEEDYFIFSGDVSINLNNDIIEIPDNTENIEFSWEYTWWEFENFLYLVSTHNTGVFFSGYTNNKSINVPTSMFWNDYWSGYIAVRAMPRYGNTDPKHTIEVQAEDSIFFFYHNKNNENNWPYTLTIDYKYDNWNTATGSYTQQYQSWDSYSVISPSIDGYSPNLNIVSGTITWDTNINVTYSEDPNSPITPGYYTLTINYEYNNSWTIAHEPYVGQYLSWNSYNITSPYIPGYSPNLNIVSGTITWDTNINVTYSEDPNSPITPGYYTLTINYKYDNWNTAATSYLSRYQSWDSYNITSPTISGYIPDFNVISGTITWNTTATVTYSEDPNPPTTPTYYTLTINYIYDNWNTVTGSYIQQYQSWNSYSVISPYITNYSPNLNIVSGTITENTNITVIYTENTTSQTPDNPSNPIYHTLTIFYFCSGKTTSILASPNTIQVQEGWTYIVQLPTKNYYTPSSTVPESTIINNTITWIMPSYDKTITVYYIPKNDTNTNWIADEEETYDLTINYIYSNWGQITSYSTKILSWKTYEKQSPNIDGYTPNRPVVSWTMPWNDLTIQVTYTPNTLINQNQAYTLTIYYLFTGNSVQAATPHIWTIAGWQSYNIGSPKITHYTPDNNTVSWTMPNDNMSITVYYIPIHDRNNNGVADEEEAYYLTINYNYDNWKTARPTYSEIFLEWESYDIESDTILKYTADKKHVKWTMSNKDRIINVTYSPTNDRNTNWIPDEEESYTLTINYLKREWWTAHTAFSKSYLKWEIYNETSPTVTNYTPDQPLISWIMPSSNTIINVYYTKTETTTTSSSWWGSSGWWSSWWWATKTTNNLSVSAYNSDNLIVDDWVWINITTNSSYRWKISFSKIQYQWTNWSWTNVSTTSKTYISDTSDEFDLWYYKMTASDSGKKTIKNLIKFKKSWKYRLYVEDKDWYSDYIQFYIDEDYNNDTTNKNEEKETSSNKSTDSNQQTNTWSNTTTNNLQNTNWDTTNQEHWTAYQDEVYTTRSCKKYNIQYISNLNVYTSPNLSKVEYFISPDYLKRYIDSKNKRVEWCPENNSWNSTSYFDKSNSNERYTAPNWKTYFITWWEWNYYSNQLSTNKWFSTLNEIKYYIRDHNPLLRTK